MRGGWGRRCRFLRGHRVDDLLELPLHFENLPLGRALQVLAHFAAFFAFRQVQEAAPNDGSLLRIRGVALTVVDDARCQELMAQFIRANPTLWAEDIGT